jgi:hypothetical protein
MPLVADAGDLINPLFSTISRRMLSGRKNIAQPEWPNSTRGGGFRPAMVSVQVPFPNCPICQATFVHSRGFNIQVIIIVASEEDFENIAVI